MTGGDAAGFSDLLRQVAEGVTSVFIVEGDADNIHGLRALAENTGVVVLHNEVLEVGIKGQRILVGGLSLGTGTSAASADVIRRLADAPIDTVTILVAHRPDVVFNIGGGLDLVITGHTHGGQISVPFFGPPVILSDVPRHVAAGGLHTVEGTPLYVSTGVGRERNQAPQVRFLVRPSIGIIDMK